MHDLPSPSVDLSALPPQVITGVDHFGVAVRSIEAALPLYAGLLGGEFVNGGDEPPLGIRTMQLRLPPGVRLELLMPATEDSQLHDFIDRHGEGFHHVAVLVDDLSEAMEAVLAAGFELTGTSTDDPSWHTSYIRPRTAFGMLYQLVQSPVDWEVAPDGVTLEGVLAGNYVWAGDRPHLRSEVPG